MRESVRSNRRLVAVCGKGGVGKTACTAMMGRALVESGRAGKLLLIDADPAMGLLSALGLKVRRTMGQVREEIIHSVRDPDGKGKHQLVGQLDYMAMEALMETDDFALLAMGRTETLGCYCPVNDLLRSTIETLSKSFDTLLIDGEAGLEQINRQVVRQVDVLMIVSDPTSRGLETAAMIRKMVTEDGVLQCGRFGIVFNRVQGNEDLLSRSARAIDLDVFAFVPQDEMIGYHDLLGKPITELPAESVALAAVRSLVESVLLDPT